MAAPKTTSTTRSSTTNGRTPTTSGRSSKANNATNGGTSGSATSTRAPDAIAMLRADHEKVIEMFDRYDDLRTANQKTKLVREICMELTVHAQLEEEIFYPAVREFVEDDLLMDEAEVEHQSAKDLIAQLEDGSPGDELFDARVKVLGEYIKHHVKEEQSEMFAQAKQSDVDLKALAEEMRTRKEELMAELK